MKEVRPVRPHPRQFTSVAEVKQAVDGLIDAWCERRCLSALGRILRTDWPANQLTDGWASLLGALKDVRGGARKEITPQEMELVEDLILAVERTMRRSP